jgi:hypothetical protein
MKDTPLQQPIQDQSSSQTRIEDSQKKIAFSQTENILYQITQ